MALTKAQMRNKVLRRIGRLPEGQVASDADADIVDETIDEAHAFLEAKGIAYWETSAIPDEIAHQLCKYLAAQVAPEFMSPSEAAIYVALEANALTEMRAAVSSPNGPIVNTYF